MLNGIRRRWRWMVGVLGSIGSIVAVLNFVLKWGILSWLWKLAGKCANLLSIHWLNLVLVIFAVFILALWLKLCRLEKYVGMSFKDDFKKDLNKNWDYHGKWELVHGGELSVTQSEMGGITKVGHLWKDYSFEFNAVIVHDRIGWIVRAQDLLNYYMIQLTPTMVRPHLRIGGNWIVLSENPHPLRINLNEPMRIRTEVRGSEARVYVNDKEMYYNNELFSMKFLQVKVEEDGKELKVGPLQSNVVVVPAFSTGRVGFRMAGQEHGRFSGGRVRPF